MIAEVSKFTTCVGFDREGLGFSSKRSQNIVNKPTCDDAHTAAATAKDISQLLALSDVQRAAAEVCAIWLSALLFVNITSDFSPLACF